MKSLLTAFWLLKDVTFFLGRVRTDCNGCNGYNFFRIIFKHLPLIAVVVGIYLFEY
jgi:hypothetical protein